VKDPTFASGDAWLTRAAIDEESSGYFLVPNQARGQTRWRQASADEIRPLYGMGQTSNNEPGDTTPTPKLCAPPVATACAKPTPRPCW
jgi:hypothetical protein